MTFYCLETKKGQVIINLSQVSYITFDKNGFTVYMNDGNYFYSVEDFAEFVDNFEIRNKQFKTWQKVKKVKTKNIKTP